MRHDLDPWSLLLGLAFATVAVAGLNDWLGDIVLDPTTWSMAAVWPVVLIVVGVVIGVVALAALRRRDRTDAARESARTPS